MRIKDDCFNVEDKHRIKIELLDLVNQPSDQEKRPCPGCRFHFPGEASLSSTGHCSSQCHIAPRQMSSDPTNYPIESGIVPLVYAFYTMRKMMPCWSCEGHLDKYGRLTKVPKLWFYSTSSFYPKLVTQFIGDMQSKHFLENSWCTRILPFSQTMFTITYSLEPFEMDSENLDLDSLRRDINVIADHVRDGVLKLARSYILKAG